MNLTAQEQDVFNREFDSAQTYLYGFDGYANVKIKWMLDFDYRSWGLKSLSAYTKEAIVTLYDEDDNEVAEFNTLLNDNWTVEDEGIDFNQAVFPQNAEVDYNENTIRIIWS